MWVWGLAESPQLVPGQEGQARVPLQVAQEGPGLPREGGVPQEGGGLQGSLRVLQVLQVSLQALEVQGELE